MASMKTLELAKELMAFDTVSPVENVEPLEFLKLYLEDHVVGAEIHDFGGVKNLTAHIDGQGPHVCLNGHMDVVPPGSNWSVTDPFRPRVVDGRIYGRGAADMKTGLAAMVNSMVDLAQDDGFDGEVTLMVVGDEEKGGKNGTEALLDQYEEGTFDYAVVGEPTDMNIQVGVRGVAWFDVILKGEEIHSSRADRADNAFEKLPAVLEVLNGLELEDDSSSLPAPSLNVTSIEADETYNSLPGRIKIGLDVRYLPSQTPSGVGETIAEALEATGFDYEVNLEIDHGGAFELQDERLKSAAARAVLESCNEHPRYITEGGSSDGRFFAERGCPFIEIGVNQEPGHKADESCRVENLEKLRETYVETVRRLM
ncbi:MAG: M20 family metallopeptidase [Candidatus Nanohaloarchaea archaeon]